jgi:hypothetical protein
LVSFSRSALPFPGLRTIHHDCSGIPNFSPYAKLQKKRVLEDSGEDKSSNLTPKSDMKKQKIETTKANITQRISEEKEKNKILEAKLFQSLISPAGISSSASSSPSVTSPIPPLLVASPSDATRNGKKE